MLALMRKISFGFSRLAINFLGPIFILPFLHLRLGDVNFGKHMVFQSVLGFFQIFADYGATVAGVSAVASASKPESQRNILINYTAARLMPVALSISIFLVFSALYPSTFGFSWLDNIFVVLLGLMFAISPVWYFLGRSEFGTVFLIQAVPRIISYVLLFFCVRGSEDLGFANLISMFSIAGVGLLGIFFCIPDIDIRLLNLKSIRQILFENFYLLITQTFATIFTYGNTILVMLICGSVQAGIFGYADKLVRSMIQLITPFVEVAFPQIAKEIASDERRGLKLARDWVVYGGVLIFLSVSILVSVIIFFREWIANYITREVIYSFSVMAPVVLFIYINNICGSQILYLYKSTKVMFFIMLSLSVLTILVSSILLYYFDALGASFAILFGELFLCLSYALVSVRVVGRNWIRG